MISSLVFVLNLSMMSLSTAFSLLSVFKIVALKFTALDQILLISDSLFDLLGDRGVDIYNLNATKSPKNM